MRRRSLLALVGSLAATGGCTGAGDADDPDSTVTAMPVPSRRDRGPEPSTPDTELRVTAATVQPGVVMVGDDSVSVRDRAGQYLVVALGDDIPDRSAVEFRFSGASYEPESFYDSLYRGGRRVDRSDAPLVFALPETGDATESELAWGERSWTPSRTVVERLEDPLPPFSVSLDGPETAGADQPVTVSVTNEGRGTGRYVFALNRVGPRIASAPVGRIAGELSPGESTTHDFEPVLPEGDQSTRYLLDVPGESENRVHVISPGE